MHQPNITNTILPRRRLSLRFSEKTLPPRPAATTPMTRKDLQRIVEEMVG